MNLNNQLISRKGIFSGVVSIEWFKFPRTEENMNIMSRFGSTLFDFQRYWKGNEIGHLNFIKFFKRQYIGDEEYI